MQTSAHPVTIAGDVVAIFVEAGLGMAPPADITVLEWAERERILSSESSALTGPYRVSVAPYQAAMHNAVNLPGVEEIVFFTAAQMGKSLAMEDIFGYFVAEDACPIIWMWPTKEVVKDWSVDTLEPFIRDTPALAKKFSAGSRKSANRDKFKKFPGGWLAVIGANSSPDLRRRRARVVLADEIDGYPDSVEGEGDPITLVTSRSETMWNRLLVSASTCTVKNESRIEARYLISNQMKYWVPCPFCGLMQTLRFTQIKYTPEDSTIDNTYYQCVGCDAKIYEGKKREMLAAGQWIAARPEIKKIIGFWINKLYSPFVTWATLANRWKAANAAKANGNKELLRVFINLDLAETWEERDEDAPDKEGLIKRCEHYTPRKLPDGVVVLTAGVDVQEDRIELELVGWGRGFESWSIENKIFYGETSKLTSQNPAFPTPWEHLDAYLDQEFLHGRGVTLSVAAAFVDSGYNATEVYTWTKTRNSRRIYASKGSSLFKHVPLGKMNRNNKAHVRMYPVGVSQIKSAIYRWLRLSEPGPGFMHFSHGAGNDATYFDQLTSERLEKKYEKGFPVKFWAKQAGARNEALDKRVYAYAALLSLSDNPPKMLDFLRDQLLERARKAAEERAQNPDQLSLLADTDEVSPPIAPPAAVPDAEAPPSAIEISPEQDQPVAEVEKVESPAECYPAKPRETEPQIIVKKSGWLK